MSGAIQDLAVLTLFVGPGHGQYAALQSGSAAALGYDGLEVIEAARFRASVGGPEQVATVGAGATIDAAVRAAEARDAMTASVREGRWVLPVGTPTRA
ncbi:hypothetical protein [Gordonia sp. NB41Y]|uniref:hypothetical protein n=1 Tax=Gordonia sp. NB41Y TaxID=875808 RepID=UPI0006B1EEA9|nr:hypothetical protein [Gordonia sp. NB41Y]KOY49259.1 hypothetical protein ISGA_11430 [Gordonia sp. NB41Y]WLP89799.1 hypothetical protein Q9K23_19950 [Gordonia sp. NB41Y]